MRILILNWKDLTHPAAGGAEVYTEEVARAWVRSGNEVTMFCSAVSGQPRDDLVQGVRIVRRGSRLTVYRAARRWWQRQPSGSFDVVVDEVNTRPFLTPAWLVGTPVVALIHQVCREIWAYEVPRPLALLGRQVLEPRWLRHYRDVPTLTVSASSETSLRQYGLRRVSVVPEGVNALVRPTVVKETHPTLLFVGRLAGNKRPGDALEAFRLLRLTVPTAQLWVVGEGPERARLEALGIPEVTFFGGIGQDEKHELMARAHVLVATSVREGWGLVVDEAAAMGTLTIAYDVPGLRDSVPPTGGVLTAPNPGGLAARLAQALREGVPTPRPGAARPWADVAEVVLAQLAARVAVPTGGTQ